MSWSSERRRRLESCRLSDNDLEGVWAAAKLAWELEGLKGGSERFYCLARILEDVFIAKLIAAPKVASSVRMPEALDDCKQQV